jgi:hypothetical protein
MPKHHPGKTAPFFHTGVLVQHVFFISFCGSIFLKAPPAASLLYAGKHGILGV